MLNKYLSEAFEDKFILNPLYYTIIPSFTIKLLDNSW